MSSVDDTTTRAVGDLHQHRSSRHGSITAGPRPTDYFMLSMIESTLVAPSAGLVRPKSTSVPTGMNSAPKPEAFGRSDLGRRRREHRPDRLREVERNLCLRI
jgi:hypothetical protein